MRGDAGDHEQLTDTPTQFIAELARQFAGEVPQLRVLRPSLEDVYLSLIEGDTDADEDLDQAAVTKSTS